MSTEITTNDYLRCSCHLLSDSWLYNLTDKQREYCRAVINEYESKTILKTMSKKSGIIYELGNGRFGVAIHSEQLPAFKNFNKVFLHVYLDILCTIPEKDPATGKKYVTLKHISTLKAIGFAD